MAKQIARLLKADIQESSDLKSIAKMLSKKGRGGDTMLAHITPKEAKILKEAGGAGTINPDTGLMEFYDGDWSIPSSYIYGSYYAPEGPPVSDYYPEEYSRGTAADIVSDPSIAAAEQYKDSAFGYQPATAGMDRDEYYFPARGEFPPEMGARTDLVLAQRAAALPQGMVDFPAVVGDAARPAIPGIPQEVREAPPPSLLSRAGDALATIKAGGGDVLDYLKKNPDLVRLLGAGAGAVAGRAQSQQAAKQIERATQEQKNVGAPYQKTGAELQRAALAGELTPQSAQAFQALRAQMAQGIESRGGVGVAQAQAQLEAFRQNLLQNQYNFGLQVSQIGDQMALGAIRTGMQLDQQLAAANQQFYTQLAAIAGGGTYGYQPPKPAGGQ